MKRAIIDTSNVLWNSLMSGKDKEYGRVFQNDKGKDVWVNGADHGVFEANSFLLTVLEDLGIQPRDMIFVVEGKNSKQLRQFMYAEYKAGKDKLDVQYERFMEMKEKLLNEWLGLGAQACEQPGLEADDVMAYLAKNLKGERWIVSGDKDLSMLVGGDIHQYRRGAIDENPFGPFPHQFGALYISLVGDTADNIKGAPGFGEGAFMKMLAHFGEDCLPAMEDLIKKRKLSDLKEDLHEFKPLLKIIDGADSVYTSYALATLYDDKVNTLRRPLTWRVGMVKPRSQIVDERLHQYAGAVKLVHKGNYEAACKFLQSKVGDSPYVTLDIETSTPPQSDDWIAMIQKSDDDNARSGVDVIGSELTGLGMTFGPNMQYTMYLTHEHVEEQGIQNISIEQVRDFVDLVPREKWTVVHNAAFELPVCYQEWGKDWADDEEYHGFLRNVRDTSLMSSYVDENRKRNLKGLSLTLLNYEQVTYEQVTSETGLQGTLKPGGRVVKTVEHPVTRMVTKTVKNKETGEKEQVEVEEVVKDEDGNPVIDHVIETRQYKMNELTAKHVLSYGADDCICTAAIANHFLMMMEIENSDEVFHAVETFPAYLTALAFVQGTQISLQKMKEMERDDDVAYDKAWEILRAYLLKIGFDGTQCPQYDEITPANIKEAFQIISGNELKTMVRTPEKIAKLIEIEAEGMLEGGEALTQLALQVAEGNVAGMNALVKEFFNGEPQLDLGSPKQMKRLLYDFLGIPVKIINDTTINERMHKPELAAACSKFKKIRAGTSNLEMTDEEMQLVKTKAKTDDTAIEFAIAFDREFIDDEAKEALEALGTMKRVTTRRSLFYRNYEKVQHWKTGKVHASLNQCSTVTRRYSSSKPNLQQLPKKGEGVRFRGIFIPHHRDAVISSIDFAGQELRLAAWKSQDKNMLSCYIGDNLKDIHSITAAGAMKLKWGHDVVKSLFEEFGSDLNQDIEGEYQLFLRLRKLGKSNPWGKKADDLRKDSKNVNFAAQFGGKAPKISETIVMPLEDAQLFLDARNEMFPDVDVAAERAADKAKEFGYAETFMQVRRHLQEGVLSDERGAADRAARQAFNMEIQGSAAEMTKLAMTRFWKSGALFKFDARFIAPIHDELVTSVHKDHALEFLRIKHECMTQPYADMEVPVWGSISLGPDFATQIECGDWFIPENIQAALDEVFAEKLAA